MKLLILIAIINLIGATRRAADKTRGELVALCTLISISKGDVTDATKSDWFTKLDTFLDSLDGGNRGLSDRDIRVLPYITRSMSSLISQQGDLSVADELLNELVLVFKDACLLGRRRDTVLSLLRQFEEMARELDVMQVALLETVRNHWDSLYSVGLSLESPEHVFTIPKPPQKRIRTSADPARAESSNNDTTKLSSIERSVSYTNGLSELL